MSGLLIFVTFILFLMENPSANNLDPDRMPHFVASDLGLHCIPLTLLWVSQIKGLRVQFLLVVVLL